MAHRGSIRILLVLLAACEAAGAQQQIPLTEPKEIIRAAPAPAGRKPKLARARALELAARYSGFTTDEAVGARLVLYADTETGLGTDRPRLAWLVSLPNASLERKWDRETPVVKCPLHVAIDAATGQFLGAYGASAPKWARAKGASRFKLSVAEIAAPPSLTVRKVLRACGHRPSAQGQFFVRYGRIRSQGVRVIIRRVEGEHDSVPLLPETYRGWVYSQRGVVLRGFSVPPGYDGPPLYATRSDESISDATGKVLGGQSY